MYVSLEAVEEKDSSPQSLELSRDNPLRLAFIDIAKADANYADMTNATIDEETRMIYTHITIEDGTNSLMFNIRPFSNDISSIDVSSIYSLSI